MIIIINNIKYNLNNKQPDSGDIITTSEGNVYFVCKSIESNQEAFHLVDLKTGEIIREGRIKAEYILDTQILKKKAYRVIPANKVVINELTE